MKRRVREVGMEGRTRASMVAAEFDQFSLSIYFRRRNEDILAWRRGIERTPINRKGSLSAMSKRPFALDE